VYHRKANALRPADGGPVIERLPVARRGGIEIERLDNESVIYRIWSGKAPGFYRLPLKGGPESPLVQVQEGSLWDAAVSPDGRHAVLHCGP
jgi:hypothetical protein